jgi:hypothetical protein
MTLFNRIRGVLPHSHGENPPFIVLPSPGADMAPLEVRLHPYQISQAHLTDNVIPLGRQLLEHGWPTSL